MVKNVSMGLLRKAGGVWAVGGKFEVVGIRQMPVEGPARKAKWRQGKPVLSAAVLFLVIAGCLGCGLIMTKNPAYLDLQNNSVAPNREFLFGTDTMGRDIFSMVWYGGRVSLSIGMIATGISTAIAVIFGAASGCAPAWLDRFLMRLTEILLSVPELLLIILLQAAFGQANVWSLSVTIGVTGWMGMAKIIRTQVRQIRGSEYVLAAKCMGGSFFHVLWRHLTPNFLPSVTFMAVMDVRSAIAAESTLSFMGLGLPVEVVSWGSMLSLAEKALLGGFWWMILIPGAFLVVTLLCMTELGNYLQKNADHRERNL